MRRLLIFAALVVSGTPWLLADAPRQAAPAQMLTVDSIMRGPDLVGSAPSAIRWSKDSQTIYFSWQRPADEDSSTWAVSRDGTNLRQLSDAQARDLDLPPSGRRDQAGRRTLATESGDLVIYDVETGERQQLTRTSENESNPRWVRNDTAVTFERSGNLYLMTLDGSTPAIVQLTDIVAAEEDEGAGPAAAGGGRGAGRGGRGGGRGGELTEAQRWLREQERELIEYIDQRAQRGRGGRGGGGRGGGRGGGGAGPPQPPIARFELEPRQTVSGLTLSGDERFVWINVVERPEIPARGQDTPNYVTESAYPEMIPGRSNVGDSQSWRKLAILDLQERESVWADASALAGTEGGANQAGEDARLLDWGSPDMSADGAHAVFSVTSQDNKDRWLVTIDPTTGGPSVLDHLHDDAWVRSASVGGSTGTGGAGIAWLPDNRRFLFLSEASGYMHLYTFDISSPTSPAQSLTGGDWEVTGADLSDDGQTVYLTTNEVHPGERHFYTMPVAGGARTKITEGTGSHAVTISPDGSTLAVVHSYSNVPPELFVMPFRAGADRTQVTTTPTEEWRTFDWIDPELVTYRARDGAEVYARLYTPEMIGARRDPRRPGVVFVHGAGYLQNAHKYWSSYYREYMFHNLLASRGYVVLDPDYRASSGYGRDWRTAIYRHMGGHDLNDVVDGADYLVREHGVDADRLGVYGGSYGGFITLMAMFTSPETFEAGAALRPVTDWAHYNHGYTSNILNTPQTDPEAYRQSSPIYFAEGLQGHLLIAHGMVDTNVFFQDSVRLAQRLVELRKENWELAGYPVENHSFTEETSWADEYRRILKLFEEVLRQ